ncbi:hypothetical protein [Luteibacter aegosomatissinici]|uniref:hypothetical protein n=1 Tax=Luteibacter aegosomatissinici TaxID=2911539 RepID=UPI001FF99DC2|nr:hypothetical protein [Luteibacter aegosomatissinici]UPG95467.1 hypothetical protein L2Y97_04980 [Luteibacter aegosomatissinici]
MHWLDGLFGWTDVIDLVHTVVRSIPAALMFPVVFIIVQGLMTVGDAHDMGNAAAIRAALHGSHCDAHGLSWSLGVALVFTLWGVMARKVYNG